MSKIKLTFTQCKQIVNNVDFDGLRDFVEDVNNQPAFMAGDMGIDSIAELKAVTEGGCAATAHSSVYYYQAAQVMAEHGDDVLDYVQDILNGQLNIGDTSWSGIAVYLLSSAVELWCYQFDDILDGVDWD